MCLNAWVETSPLCLGSQDSHSSSIVITEKDVLLNSAKKQKHQIRSQKGLELVLLLTINQRSEIRKRRERTRRGDAHKKWQMLDVMT